MVNWSCCAYRQLTPSREGVPAWRRQGSALRFWLFKISKILHAGLCAFRLAASAGACARRVRSELRGCVVEASEWFGDHSRGVKSIGTWGVVTLPCGRGSVTAASYCEIAVGVSESVASFCEIAVETLPCGRGSVTVASFCKIGISGGGASFSLRGSQKLESGMGGAESA